MFSGSIPRNIVLIAAASAFLAGCERGLAIDIAGSIGAPSFFLKSSVKWWAGLRQPPCASLVSVVGQGQRLWTISSGARCTALSRLEYGVLPEGFSTIIPAKALLPGSTYSISATGGGWSGQAQFTDNGQTYRLVRREIRSAP